MSTAFVLALSLAGFSLTHLKLQATRCLDTLYGAEQLKAYPSWSACGGPLADSGDAASHLEASRGARRNGAARDAAYHSLRALQLRPADAETWALHAELLCASNDFGAALDVAASRAHNLAPQSLPLAIHQTLLAARHWPRAGAQTRGAWLRAAEVALEDAESLTSTAARYGLERNLCLAFGERLPWWCEHAPQWREICKQDSLSRKKTRFCERSGFRMARLAPLGTRAAGQADE